MKIILHEDGSIEFPDGVPTGMVLYNFMPIGGNKFVPKFLPCTQRENRCRMSACGKRPVFRWHCLTFKKDVVVRDCEKCNVRQEPGQGCAASSDQHNGSGA